MVTEKLESLASSIGILTKYHDWKGVLRTVPAEAVMAVLRSLGVPIDNLEQIDAAIAARHRQLWQEALPPCVVAWDYENADLRVRLPISHDGAYKVYLTMENGEQRQFEGRLGDLPIGEQGYVDGENYAARQLSIPVGMHGYHKAVIELGDRQGECFIICAPLSAYRTPESDKGWGLFAPLYALRRHGGSGVGDVAEMMQVGKWAGQHGGSLLGTLPLLASFLSEPYEFSPYAPVSRAFWNELYVDPYTAPGVAESAGARTLLDGADFQAEVKALRELPLVDYRREMALRRRALEQLAQDAWQNPGIRGDMEAFMGRKSRVDDYARFRAVTEAHGRVWRDWPERQRQWDIRDGDFDEAARRYHIYAQFAMDAQLARLKAECGVTLYLDLPVGVHRFGYDTWRDREVFALDMSAGAPPDALFSEGQEWGCAPMHPQGLRHNHYRHFIDSIRHHLDYAGMLRIDHAMGLHRMYWVPEGFSPKDGVYVHYEAGEMYAILSLESHRQQGAVTGEDLGTVPDYVGPSMQRHGLSRLYIGQFSLPQHEGGEIIAPKSRVVASLNTHDMPTFSGYCSGADIDVRREMGLIDDQETAEEHTERQKSRGWLASYLQSKGLLAADKADDVSALMAAFHAYLAASDAQWIILNLEDLWLEDRPQNVPGTHLERPNWRRRMSRPIEDVIADADLTAILDAINHSRKGQ